VIYPSLERPRHERGPSQAYSNKENMARPLKAEWLKA